MGPWERTKAQNPRPGLRRLCAGVDGWRAAEVREREHRREEGPMSPLESFEAAMELYELCPPPSPEVEALRAAEDDKAREVWRKLRKHCAWVPEDASRG
jgi:DNA-binding LacI/PurR family transcriptional regulator